MEEWLTGLKLDRYLANFIENGYDDIDYMSGLTNTDLEEIGITLAGHRKKILLSIKRMEQSGNDVDGPDNEPSHDIVPEPLQSTPTEVVTPPPEVVTTPPEVVESDEEFDFELSEPVPVQESLISMDSGDIHAQLAALVANDNGNDDHSKLNDEIDDFANMLDDLDFEIPLTPEPISANRFVLEPETVPLPTEPEQEPESEPEQEPEQEPEVEVEVEDITLPQESIPTIERKASVKSEPGNDLMIGDDFGLGDINDLLADLNVMSVDVDEAASESIQKDKTLVDTPEDDFIIDDGTFDYINFSVPEESEAPAAGVLMRTESSDALLLKGANDMDLDALLDDLEELDGLSVKATPEEKESRRLSRASMIEEGTAPPPLSVDEKVKLDKEEKIRIALSKIKEASVTKAVINVTYNNEVKTIAIDESMFARDACNMLVSKFDVIPGPHWVICENIVDLNLERQLLDHENLMSVYHMWGRESSNKWMFRNDSEKYKHVPLGNEDQYLTETGAEERPIPIPEITGILQHKEGRGVKSRWRKGYFILDPVGLYVSKDSKSSEKKLYVSFDACDIYVGRQQKKYFKAHTDFVLVFKPLRVWKESSLKIICVDDSSEFEKWRLGILMAKYGHHILTNEQRANKESKSNDRIDEASVETPVNKESKSNDRIDEASVETAVKLRAKPTRELIPQTEPVLDAQPLEPPPEPPIDVMKAKSVPNLVTMPTVVAPKPRLISASAMDLSEAPVVPAAGPPLAIEIPDTISTPKTSTPSPKVSPVPSPRPIVVPKRTSNRLSGSDTNAVPAQQQPTSDVMKSTTIPFKPSIPSSPKGPSVIAKPSMPPPNLTKPVSPKAQTPDASMPAPKNTKAPPKTAKPVAKPPVPLPKKPSVTPDASSDTKPGSYAPHPVMPVKRTGSVPHPVMPAKPVAERSAPHPVMPSKPSIPEASSSNKSFAPHPVMPSKPPSSRPPGVSFEEKLDAIAAMGFDDREYNSWALRENNGNVEQAVEQLMKGISKPKNSVVDSETPPTLPKKRISIGMPTRLSQKAISDDAPTLPRKRTMPSAAPVPSLPPKHGSPSNNSPLVPPNRSSNVSSPESNMPALPPRRGESFRGPPSSTVPSNSGDAIVAKKPKFGVPMMGPPKPGGPKFGVPMMGPAPTTAPTPGPSDEDRRRPGPRPVVQASLSSPSSNSPVGTPPVVPRKPSSVDKPPVPKPGTKPSVVEKSDHHGTLMRERSESNPILIPMMRERSESKSSLSDVPNNEAVYLEWLNEQLGSVGKRAKNLSKDIKNAVLIIEAMQVASGRHAGKFSSDPKFAMHRIENWKVALNFAKSLDVDVCGLSAEALHNLNSSHLSQFFVGIINSLS